MVPGDAAEGLRRLISGGADPDERDTRGATPLMWAAQGGMREAVAVLLRAGARPDAEDEDGNCALHYSAQGLAPSVLPLLLAAGACGDPGNQSGETPADVAVQTALLFDAGRDADGRFREALELLAAAGGTMNGSLLAVASGYVRGVCVRVMAGRMRPLGGTEGQG